MQGCLGGVEPHKRERVSAWRTAIGLQDVDGLRVSDYLKEIAVKHIEGDIVIKYLRSCGFKVNNELFADNSWYFRNALVRAIYRNPQKGIQPDKSFLVKFFRNLLLGENNELKNRYMLIGYKDDENDAHTSTHTSSIDIQPSSENVTRLVLAIGKEEMSVKRIMEACQKRGVSSPTWSINGGFVVVTFIRPSKGDIQGVPQGVPHGVPQGGTQEEILDKWIENQIRENPQITTEELAQMSKKGLRTIKRHIAKMPHIRYVGSGYSGHWEVLDKE